ncbi:hypothetical protein BC833DRAFT_526192 [Globomyces pollinis-pini]|nr:hypothetical protein BC833DRAFT_526192 [Globomyces pollinis-pini]
MFKEHTKNQINPSLLTTYHTSTINWNQSLQFGLMGFTLHGPYFFAGFRLLDRLFGMSRNMSTVFLKTIGGHCLVFPPFICLLLSYKSLLEGKDFQTTIDRVTMQGPDIFLNGSVVWPFANMINFKFVPVPYRLAYTNLVGIGWNSYLSYAVNE